MEDTRKLRVGISIGDINGIGSEIVLKTFKDNRMLDFCTPVIFSSRRYITKAIKHFKLDMQFNGVRELDQIVPGRINVVSVWQDDVDLDWGNATREAGAYGIESLVAAVTALKKDEIDVLVTAPINKATAYSDDFKFPGHTDYLAQELEGDALMFMVSDSLRVGLLTDHISLSQVADAVTPHVVKVKAGIIKESLIKDFNIRKPRVAILGIDPHTGDGGVIGTADQTVLAPTIEEMKKKGQLVFGPYAADGFFGSNAQDQFDAVIATYHDQGLIPFKTLTFGTGVNYTAGLSHVRTSPDHGTGFDIAGQGVANPQSFSNAVHTAISIYRNRQEYAALTENVLQRQRRNER